MKPTNKVPPWVQAMILQAKNELTKQIREETFKLMLGLPVLALRDEFGFGKQRNERFIEKMLSIYNAYADGIITLEEIEDVLKEETGLEIEGFR